MLASSSPELIVDTTPVVLDLGSIPPPAQTVKFEVFSKNNKIVPSLYAKSTIVNVLDNFVKDKKNQVITWAQPINKPDVFSNLSTQSLENLFFKKIGQ